MKLKLFLILLVAVMQLIGPDHQANAERVDNDGNGSLDQNAAKHKARKCPMERYGMCQDIGHDEIAYESQKKRTEKRAKCVRWILNMGRMATTHKLIGMCLSKWLKLKKTKDIAQQT